MLILRIAAKLCTQWNYLCCCSVVQSCPTLCNAMDCSTPGPPVPHHLPKLAQVHVHCISEAIQPSHPMMPTSPCLQCRRPKFDLWIGKIPWRRKWLPTPAFVPGEFHGQRSLAGYSPWDHKESDMTE